MGASDIRIDDPRLYQLYRYWKAKCAGRAMPARRDIDPLEMKWLLGNLSLIDVRQDQPDFRFRLAGSNVVALFGKELTGRAVTEARYCGKRPPLAQQCGDVATSQVPSFLVMVLGVDHRRIIYRHLVLPLSSDGRNVDLLLAAAVMGRAPVKMDRDRLANA
jgi:hypothetical protein